MSRYEELLAKALAAAEGAERWIASDPADPGTVATAAVHATLAEAYARLASSTIVHETNGLQQAAAAAIIEDRAGRGRPS